MNRIFWIVFSIILLHTGLSGQKNGIGLNFIHNDYSGLNAELRYDRQLSNRWIVGGSVSTSFQNVTSYRFGVKYKALEIGKFSFHSGLDYSIIYSNHKLDSELHTFRFLEVPLDFRYKLSDTYSISVGASFSSPIKSYSYKTHLLNNLRLGVIKKF